jgi:ABC-type bacteriocin/lantibiotic exporter with double-glycine peptidase domain
MLDQPVVDIPDQAAEPLGLQTSIQLRDVGFLYESHSAVILDKFNLFIVKGSRIGIVGETGCGKSTALDLLMGLLEPTSGSVYVDDRPLTTAIRSSWQASISHVPQDVFVADASLLENITFGIDIEAVEHSRVLESIQIAELSGLEIASPALLLSQSIGERGSRLSAGERQRVGIARAIYQGGDVLVLDEGTNSIDEATEQRILNNLTEYRPDLTLIIVSHRMSTVRACDTVAVISKGRIVAEGPFDELRESSPELSALIRQTE